MIVTRTGLHFPKPEYVAWRKQAEAQILHQVPIVRTITEPVQASVLYWPPDRRRRDCPAILDSLWHVFERIKLVADDSLIQNVYYQQMPMTFAIDGKVIAMCKITLTPISETSCVSPTISIPLNQLMPGPARVRSQRP